MLLYPQDLLTARDLVSPSDFFLDSHRQIHRAMVCMSVSRQSVDLVTLCRWMEDEGTLNAVGGPTYLASLDSTMPMRGSVRQYAAALRELACRRSLVGIGVEAASAARNGTNSEEVISAVEAGIAALRAERSDDLVDASDAVDRVSLALRGDGNRPAFPTGISGLDAKTMGGIRPGELWTVGALPSRGKSALARQIASSAVQKGIAALIFSLEMSVEEWFGVDQANDAGIEPWRMREPQYLTAAARRSLEVAGDRLRSLPMWFEESSLIHVDKIVAKARLAAMQKGVQLVVVDYAQRVQGNGREMPARMADVAEKLASLAKSSKVAVLLLSQLKRPPDINTRPTLEDLKESGYIGAHSHTVVLSYRPVDRATEDFTGDDELIIAKQRFGPIGSIPVRFNGDKLRFEPREW